MGTTPRLTQLSTGGAVAHPTATPAGRRQLPVRRLGLGVAVAALGVALAACTSGPATSPAATVTVTSTTTPPAGSTTSPGAGGSTTTTPAGSVTTTPGSGSEAPGATSAAGALPSCASGLMRVSVQAAAGGGSAGHQEYLVIATNISQTACAIQGYPGVSLTAPGTGAQLGAPADRVPGSSPLLRLQPGGTATAPLQLTQAANYPADACGPTAAAGFRIYLPGQTAAAFAATPVPACSTASVHLLTVKPFNA
ncbi:MAG: DUF4232 domain-containing protein [Lapillicoccus sp.]